MKPLRSLLDRMHPLFSEGGKFAWAYPAYEALDTFLYTPGEVTHGRTHIRDAIDLKRVMSIVVVALVPTIFMALYNTGYQANLAIERVVDSGMVSESDKADVAYGWQGDLMAMTGVGFDPGSPLSNLLYGAIFFVPVYLVTVVAGGTCEAIFSIMRKHEINEGFLVTSMLFPLTLPPTIPLWQVAIGIIFGVVIGKEVFGGTGKNFLNPALTARAYLYFAHAQALSGDKVWTAADGYSGATILGAVASQAKQEMDVVNRIPQLYQGKPIPTPDGPLVNSITWMDSFLGWEPGSMGETSALACIIGAVILIMTGVGSWRIMAATTLGAVGLAALFWWMGSETVSMFQMPPWWHLVAGGFAFGVVYMATDPVSASMTRAGKWIYGILVGALTILIRVVNPAYPEGIMLAILLGNVFAPVIDYFVVQANVKRRALRYES